MDIVWTLAAGGGGSSSFGGGGGGGGGGGSSGGGGGFGGGGGGGGSDASLLEVVVVWGTVAALVALFSLFVAVRLRRRQRRARTAREQRARQARLAAAEATEDDAHFAPEVVEAAAHELFVALQVAWSERDHDALRPLAGADLYVEWERRLADFRRKRWHNVVKLGEEPLIHYVGLENQEDDAEDRVVVSIECRLEDYVVNEVTGVVVKKENEKSTTVRLCEYWTLAWTPGGWRIDSIQNEEEGAHHLEAPLVASPWSDEVRLRDEALVGLAVADAAPTGSPSPGELVDVDFAVDARAAALDLSLVDGRFAPAVLEAAVRRAVRAWVAAVDGADDRLLQLATPDGAQALLYPRGADRTARLVIRAGVVEEVRIVELDTEGGCAELTVEVALRGRRYVEDRNTAGVLEGERERETTSRERLVLALDDEDPGVPWRVVGRG